jgi:proteasome lid subunit RPN8/RPN11
LNNVAPDPLHAFEPDPREWVKALYSDPAPIGLFHSHPISPPLPSAADMQGLKALGPDFMVYLIGSPGTDSGLLPVLNGFIISRESSTEGKTAVQLLPATLQALLK